MIKKGGLGEADLFSVFVSLYNSEAVQSLWPIGVCI